MSTIRIACVALACLLCACVAQPQPQPAYYPQAAQPQPSPAYGAQPEVNDDAAAGGVAMAPASGGQAPPAAAVSRRITFNGAPASQRDLATLDVLERQWGNRLPDGHYWYDAVSGAAGYWGGPMIGTLPAGLHLGGALPANASGGGNGNLSGVFISGRELHPHDVAQLQALVGEVFHGVATLYAPDGQIALVRRYDNNVTDGDDVRIEGVELPPTSMPVCSNPFSDPPTTTRCTR